MIEIAICEDDVNFLDKIESEINRFLAELNLDYRVSKFSNRDDLMYSLKEKKYSLYFFDIELGDDDGIELARQIRNKDNEGIFVFITNKNERVYEVFELDTFGFVRKSNFETEFNSILNRLFKEIDKYINRYILKTEEGEVLICIKNISTIERLGGIIYISTDNAKYKCKYRYTTELPFEIDNRIFFEIYRGLFVSFRHVSYIKDGYVVMNCGDEYPISRRNKKGFKELFKEYMIN